MSTDPLYRAGYAAGYLAGKKDARPKRKSYPARETAQTKRSQRRTAETATNLGKEWTSAEVLLYEEKVFELALIALEDIQKRDYEDA